MQSVSMANVPKPEKLNTWPVTAMIAPAESAKEYGNGQPFGLRVRRPLEVWVLTSLWALTRNLRSLDHGAPLPCKSFWNRKRLTSENWNPTAMHDIWLSWSEGWTRLHSWMQSAVNLCTKSSTKMRCTNISQVMLTCPWVKRSNVSMVIQNQKWKPSHAPGRKTQVYRLIN